jgi:hypothetical protein
MERMDWPARTFETGYAKIHDGYEPCGGDPKPEAIPRGLDWGTVEKREVLELQTKEGKPNKSLLVMVKGQRGHAAFVGFRDGSYLDSEIGDWVLIRGVGRPSTDVLPPSWGAVKQYHFSEFAPIAGPPAWTKRDPAPKHLPCGPTLEFGGARSAGGEPSPPGKSVSDDKLDFDAERIWPHGDGAFLFKVAVPPKTPLADGPSYIDGFIAEAPASLKNLELLDKATRKLPIWVIGRFVRVQSGDGSRLPVMKLEEVLPRLFEPPPTRVERRRWASWGSRPSRRRAWSGLPQSSDARGVAAQCRLEVASLDRLFCSHGASYVAILSALGAASLEAVCSVSSDAFEEVVELDEDVPHIAGEARGHALDDALLERWDAYTFPKLVRESDEELLERHHQVGPTRVGDTNACDLG